MKNGLEGDGTGQTDRDRGMVFIGFISQLSTEFWFGFRMKDVSLCLWYQECDFFF